jgi:hypothetical protein
MKGVSKMSLYEVVEKLSEERQLTILKLAMDMLSAQQSEEFDCYSANDISNIRQATDEITHGNCVSFSSGAEIATYLGIDME